MVLRRTLKDLYFLECIRLETLAACKCWVSIIVKFAPNVPIRFDYLLFIEGNFVIFPYHERIY